MDLKSFVGSKLKDFLVGGIMQVMVVEEHNDRSVELARLKVCKGFNDVPACPRYNKGFDQCMECKCIIAAKAKSLTNRNPKKWGRIELTHCPLGKWNDEEIMEYYKD